ncbi:uncharacterized protein L201_008101 [Kwoniella dendrophila CBS 6074]|uniref:Uncharacterized protein n=1 Tax=Kwoniella dendrophila CBS 6074 TaxID=1295534 RepID=A0AAX4K6Z2_9TREE
MTSNSTVPSQPIPTASSSSSSSSGLGSSTLGSSGNNTGNAIPESTISRENVGPDSLATLEETRKVSAISPPIDPSKLNNQPAPLMSPPLDSTLTHTEANTTMTQQPLRSPNQETSLNDSVYLDGQQPIEPSSHPTIAETGILSTSSSDPTGGPGPKQGQLKRVESKPQSPDNIIKLGSLGGEGLKMKPPTESPSDN